MKVNFKVLVLIVSMIFSGMSAWAQLNLEPGAKYYLKHGEMYVGNFSGYAGFTIFQTEALEFTVTSTFAGYTFECEEGALGFEDYLDLMLVDFPEFFEIEGNNDAFSMKYYNPIFQGDYYLSEWYGSIDPAGDEDTSWSIVETEGGGGGVTATRKLCRLVNGGNVFRAAPTTNNGALVTGGYNLGSAELERNDYNNLWFSETTDGGSTCKLVHANSGAYLCTDRMGYATIGEVGDALNVSGQFVVINGVEYTITDIDPINNIEYTLNGSGIGTLCLPFDFYASHWMEELAANIVTVGNGETLNLVSTDCSQTAMQKNVGYIMIGKPNTTYSIDFVENQETANIEGNLLSGSLCRTQVEPGSFYGLKTTDGTDGNLGSAVLALAETSAIPANKAYLGTSVLGSSVSQFVLNIDAGQIVTGVDLPVAVSQCSNAYDLAGRRVGFMRKGISIVDGKKMIK